MPIFYPHPSVNQDAAPQPHKQEYQKETIITETYMPIYYPHPSVPITAQLESLLYGVHSLLY